MIRTAPILAAAVLFFACSRPAAPPGGPDGSSAGATGPGPRGPASPVALPASYRIQNDIPECLVVEGKQVTAAANLVFADITLKTTRNVAACICPSNWLLWRSVTSTEGIETEYASGNLLAPQPGTPAIERRIVLLGDRYYPPAGPLIVHVGCAPAP